MKNENNAAATENKFVAKCKEILDKMYVDKEADNKFIKPVISWSILGGEFALAGIIALIVFLCI